MSLQGPLHHDAHPEDFPFAIRYMWTSSLSGLQKCCCDSKGWGAAWCQRLCCFCCFMLPAGPGGPSSVTHGGPPLVLPALSHKAQDGPTIPSGLFRPKNLHHLPLNWKTYETKHCPFPLKTALSPRKSQTCGARVLEKMMSLPSQLPCWPGSTTPCFAGSGLLYPGGPVGICDTRVHERVCVVAGRAGPQAVLAVVADMDQRRSVIYKASPALFLQEVPCTQAWGGVALSSWCFHSCRGSTKVPASRGSWATSHGACSHRWSAGHRPLPGTWKHLLSQHIIFSFCPSVSILPLFSSFPYPLNFPLTPYPVLWNQENWQATNSLWPWKRPSPPWDSCLCE